MRASLPVVLMSGRSAKADAAGDAAIVKAVKPGRPRATSNSGNKTVARIKIELDETMPTEAAHFMVVAYSTFPQPFRLSPKIMSLPVELPPMAGSFVACLLEERPGGPVPLAALIFKADVSFECPQMPDFILQLIDSVDELRKLSRRSNVRVLASEFVLKNPSAELDREKCQEIFYWQYLGHTQSKDYKLS